MSIVHAIHRNRLILLSIPVISIEMGYCSRTIGASDNRHRRQRDSGASHSLIFSCSLLLACSSFSDLTDFSIATPASSLQLQINYLPSYQRFNHTTTMRKYRMPHALRLLIALLAAKAQTTAQTEKARLQARYENEGQSYSARAELPCRRCLVNFDKGEEVECYMLAGIGRCDRCARGRRAGESGCLPVGPATHRLFAACTHAVRILTAC